MSPKHNCSLMGINYNEDNYDDEDDDDDDDEDDNDEGVFSQKLIFFRRIILEYIPKLLFDLLRV